MGDFVTLSQEPRLHTHFLRQHIGGARIDTSPPGPMHESRVEVLHVLESGLFHSHSESNIARQCPSLLLGREIHVTIVLADRCWVERVSLDARGHSDRTIQEPILR